MAKVTITPMIGEMRRDRLDSLRGCHAVYERHVVKSFAPGEMHVAIDRAIKELLLADRHMALFGKMTFIVQVDLEPT